METTTTTQAKADGAGDPPSTRVMSWTPTGWAMRDLDAAQVSRRRHAPSALVTCAAAERRHKRPADPAPPTLPKRRRTMGPPRPGSDRSTVVVVTALAKKAPAKRAPLAMAAIAPIDSRPAAHATTTTTTPQTTATPPEPRARPLAEVPLRRWKRVRPLGCGTFGCVHEVSHPVTGERVALKEMGLLPNDYRGSRDGPPASAFRPGISPASVHMAFRELAAVAVLGGHPSVATVRDARVAMARGGPCSTGIECALLMDLMDGHLGRVIRFMAGRGEGSLSASSSSSSLSLVASSSSSATPPSASFFSSSSSSLASSSSSSSSSSVIDLTGAPSVVSPTASPRGTTRAEACPFDLRVRVARLVARDILPALAFMHDRLGLAHRDIKPNNILYTGDVASESLQFRLADFGLARFVRRPGPAACQARGRSSKRRRQAMAPGDTGTPSPALPPTAAKSSPSSASTAKNRASTASDVAFGTLFTANVVTHLYKPPEVLFHYGTHSAVEHGLAYGCAVDMWSFGVVLMEVLAGGHLTPSEPEETLVKRVRGVFRLDGPPRPHLIRDLVRAVAARAALGRSGIGAIPRVPADDAPGESSDGYADLIDLVERLLCVDPRQRMTAAAALVHPFVVGDPRGAHTDHRQGPASARGGDNGIENGGDDDDDDDGDYRDPSTPVSGVGPCSVADEGDVDRLGDGAKEAPDGAARFLPPCAYRALAAGVARADQRPRAGDPAVRAPTLAARRTAVSRACTFADRYGLSAHTVASAVVMLDHYVEERAAACSDEGILVAAAGALLVACSLYECRWPTHDQFAALGVVPSSWYGVDRRAPSGAVRTPASDAPLRAAVSLFETLHHLTPHPDAINALVDGSVALAVERGDASPWRAMAATFSRYPPSLTLQRR